MRGREKCWAYDASPMLLFMQLKVEADITPASCSCTVYPILIAVMDLLLFNLRMKGWLWVRVGFICSLGFQNNASHSVNWSNRKFLDFFVGLNDVFFCCFSHPTSILQNFKNCRALRRYAAELAVPLWQSWDSFIFSHTLNFHFSFFSTTYRTFNLLRGRSRLMLQCSAALLRREEIIGNNCRK